MSVVAVCGIIESSKNLSRILRDQQNKKFKLDILNRRTEVLKEKSKINIIKYKRL